MILMCCVWNGLYVDDHGRTQETSTEFVTTILGESNDGSDEEVAVDVARSD